MDAPLVNLVTKKSQKNAAKTKHFIVFKLNHLLSGGQFIDTRQKINPSVSGG